MFYFLIHFALNSSSKHWKQMSWCGYVENILPWNANGNLFSIEMKVYFCWEEISLLLVTKCNCGEEGNKIPRN